RRHTRSKRDWSSDVCSSDLNEIKIKNHDFLENFSGRFCDPYFLFVRPCRAGGATDQNGCGCCVAAKTKRIRLSEAGGRRPYSGRSEERRVGKECRTQRGRYD